MGQHTARYAVGKDPRFPAGFSLFGSSTVFTLVTCADSSIPYTIFIGFLRATLDFIQHEVFADGLRGVSIFQ